MLRKNKVTQVGVKKIKQKKGEEKKGKLDWLKNIFKKSEKEKE